jgi:hypothetical protein
MDEAKRARTAETPKQPSLGLKLRAPCLYPDRVYSAIAPFRANYRRGSFPPTTGPTAEDGRFRVGPSRHQDSAAQIQNIATSAPTNTADFKKRKFAG